MSLQSDRALVALATHNLKSLVDFYTHLLGQKPQSYLANVYAEFELAGLHLGLFVPKADNRHEFESLSSGRMSLCLQVENLEQAIAHLVNLGYPPPGEIVVASHGREIYAYDPEGNRLILHQSH